MANEDGVTLTVKQEAFVLAYIETNNASEAYRRAYDCSKMTEKSINENASKLLKHAKVAPRVAAHRAKLSEKHGVTADRVIRELALIGFSNMLDYIKTTDEGSAFIDLSKLSRDQAAAIGEITSETYMEGRGEEAVAVKRTRFKLNDKRAALVDLGKHLGLFKEIKEISGPNGGPIETSERPSGPGDDHLAEIGQRYNAKPLQLITGGKK